MCVGKLEINAVDLTNRDVARLHLTLVCEQDISISGSRERSRESSTRTRECEERLRGGDAITRRGERKVEFSFSPGPRHKWRACSQANLTPKRCHSKTGNLFVRDLFIPLMLNVAIDNTCSWSSPPTQYDCFFLCFKRIPK